MGGRVDGGVLWREGATERQVCIFDECEEVDLVLIRKRDNQAGVAIRAAGANLEPIERVWGFRHGSDCADESRAVER